jgi:hypothetical protein
MQELDLTPLPWGRHLPSGSSRHYEYDTLCKGSVPRLAHVTLMLVEGDYEHGQLVAVSMPRRALAKATAHLIDTNHILVQAQDMSPLHLLRHLQPSSIHIFDTAPPALHQPAQISLGIDLNLPNMQQGILVQGHAAAALSYVSTTSPKYLYHSNTPLG